MAVGILTRRKVVRGTLGRNLLQGRMHATQPINDCLDPAEVVLTALQGSIMGLGMGNVAQIADLVGQLD